MLIDQSASPIIQSITFMSVDNKTKVKPRGQLLKEILTAFSSFIDSVDPSVPIFFVREQQVNTFTGKGARTSASAKTGVASVVGLMDYIIWLHRHAEWQEIYPVTIKKLLTGYGKAEKQQVAQSMSDYLGLQHYQNDDESDAAAVAVAWLIQHRQINQIIKEDTDHERIQSAF